MFLSHGLPILSSPFSHVTPVLSWLRRIGWLHRDISSGNLMLRRLLTTTTDAPLQERYQLKLHDLEYSLEYAEAPQPDDGVVCPPCFP